MMFDEYVADKTVALVGPARPTRDQSAEIEAHDLVYRLAWSPNHIPEYGSRVDIAYLNGAIGRQILDDEYRAHRQRIDACEWWVFKTKHSRQYRPNGRERLAFKPAIRNENAITGALFDLVHFPIKHVTVYGADLYAGGPDDAHHPEYDSRPAGVKAEFILLHRPMEQYDTHKAIVATGKVRGDDRYLAAVGLSRDQYAAVVADWQAAYDTHQAAEPALT